MKTKTILILIFAVSILTSAVNGQECAQEGEYTSVEISVCCEELNSCHINQLLGSSGGALCYDPVKGIPVCENLGSMIEGWYYSKTGDILIYESCGGSSCECTDSDGGTNYYVKGTTCAPMYGYPGLIDCQSDECINPDPYCVDCIDQVLEYYCNGIAMDSETVDCENGCIDGACTATRNCYDDSECSAVDEFCEFADCGIETGECTRVPDACMTAYYPVCGCDGKTYYNDCTRLWAKVSKDYDGVCTPVQRCINDDECSADEFCEYAMCAGGSGQCTRVPDACMTAYDLVCGCDGKTYSNNCVRQVAKVSKEHDGACVSTSTCTDSDGGRNYDEKGTTCGPMDMTTGLIDCQSDECIYPGPYCVDCIDQVLEYYCNGIAMDSETVDCENGCIDGACLSTGSCYSDDQCSDNEFCEFADCAAETGECTIIPPDCITLYDPVCGCDGETYSNDCYRQVAKVSKDHDGACVSTSTCTDSDGGVNYYEKGTVISSGESKTDSCTYCTGACLPDDLNCVVNCGAVVEYYCDDNEISSGIGSQTHVCPEICLDGACITATSSCYSDDQCRDNEFCEFADCAAETGECTLVPGTCMTFEDPVCGCDGETYANDCTRQLAKVSKKHDGACVSTAELIEYLDQWKQGVFTITQVMHMIGLWDS